ncbi:FecR family protein [Sphingobacterium arenae]|uniref:FecR domain-containing protein n=1 Tax=Sphingobacterium arenae TaxID=1280598 RepID=A0ABR7Y4G1_9SPHI|nr:FecR family protein [Sphingobacterium arenae]MBD1426176.1 FecR domain-containing protein [Sphingobacterium arenae]
MALDKNDKTYTLLRAFINDQLERSQLEELFALIEEVDAEQFNAAVRAILDEEHTPENLEFIQERVELLQEDILAKIVPEQIQTLQRKPFNIRLAIGIAAMLAIVFTITYLWQRRENLSPAAVHGIASTILPGGNKATITVNGQDFELDANQGELIWGADSLFYADGQLLTTTSARQSVQVKTPLGGQYQLTLADGSQVWLNAGSKLTYDTGFGTDNRALRLEGEAYFDVAKNLDLPFTVEINGQHVEVLGTAFNISAYTEEPMVKTTLQRGALAVANNHQKLILKPNQQAILDKNEKKIVTRDVNATSVVAWKDGIFDFHGMDVEECMRVIARWYQLDVVYKEQVPSVLLGGKMSRGVRLSTFLEFLEANFDIHGEVTADRKLIITANNR